MTEYSRAKAAADKAFSLYIRLRDSDASGMVSCCTCGSSLPWREANAGHFVTRTHISTRWDERNCHAQCPRCNKWEGGEQYRHGIYVDKTHGNGTADELIREGARIRKQSAGDLRRMAKEFLTWAKELAEAKGLEV